MTTQEKPQHEQIGEAFLSHYLKFFTTNRAELTSLYTNASVLTVEGRASRGTEEIMQVLSRLPGCRMDIKHCTYQPTPANTVLIFIQGDLIIENDKNPISFSRLFHLFPDQTGRQFYIGNEIFNFNFNY